MGNKHTINNQSDTVLTKKNISIILTEVYRATKP